MKKLTLEDRHDLFIKLEQLVTIHGMVAVMHELGEVAVFRQQEAAQQASVEAYQDIEDKMMFRVGQLCS